MGDENGKAIMPSPHTNGKFGRMVGQTIRYTDKERVSAVTLATGYGYPGIPGALAKASEETGVPSQTLSSWVKGETFIDPELLLEQRDEFASRYAAIVKKLQDHVMTEEFLVDVKPRDVFYGLAVATDQMVNLQGIPDKLRHVLLGVIQALSRKGIDPQTFFNTLRDKIEQSDNGY